jgi:cyanate lyase
MDADAGVVVIVIVGGDYPTIVRAHILRIPPRPHAPLRRRRCAVVEAGAPCIVAPQKIFNKIRYLHLSTLRRCDWHAICSERLRKPLEHTMPTRSAAAAPSTHKPLTRLDVTEMVIEARLKKGLSWTKIAQAIGQSKEWTTAALLGQMQMSKAQAQAAGKLLGLPPYAVLLLQQVPYKGSLPTAVPTDPLIYRFYELVNVYGTTIKELIHEEFGDGIMSAIDFKMDLKREADPNGDRVHIVMSGKYLQYKTY